MSDLILPVPPEYVPVLTTVVIEIGAWNMDAQTTKSVAHGLGDLRTKIRNISVMIASDNFTAANSFFDTNNFGTGNQHVDLTATSIAMSRATGGKFDSTSFDHATQNRGWITIQYEA